MTAAGSDPEPAIAGVLLAAGRGGRFGTDNKLLVEVNDKPVVVHAVETLVAATVAPVVVVLGFEADRVRRALADYPVDFVINPDFADGQATSVRTGVSALPDRCAAAVFALGDMPVVRPETVDALVTAYCNDVGEILAAAADGKRGNPVLFAASYFADLRDVQGDTGGRELIIEQGRLIDTADPGVRLDVDTPADLAEIREHIRGRARPDDSDTAQ